MQLVRVPSLVYRCDLTGKLSITMIVVMNSLRYSTHFLKVFGRHAPPLAPLIRKRIQNLGINCTRSQPRGKAGEKSKRRNIHAIVGRRPYTCPRREEREATLIHLAVQPAHKQVPRLLNVLACNARSLTHKVDELELLLKSKEADIACITETWAHSNIPDELLCLQNFQLFRKDRNSGEGEGRGRGGSVACYVHQSLQARRRADLEKDDIECLWVQMHPTRLPSAVSTLIVGTLYHPRKANEKTLQQKTVNYLVNVLDMIKSVFSQMGLV